jgi:hypothetical protein
MAVAKAASAGAREASAVAKAVSEGDRAASEVWLQQQVDKLEECSQRNMVLRIERKPTI